MKLFSKLAAVSAVLYGTVNGTGNSSNSIFRTSYRGDIVIEAVPSTHKQIEYVKGLEDKFELDFWFPPDARAIQPNEHFQVRITAAEKYMFIKDLLDSNMMFRILHNNLDQMVADSVHKTNDELQFSASAMDGFVDRTEDVNSYNYFKYHTQSEIENWAKQMTDHFDFIDREVYGKSIEGLDLFVLKIRDAQGRSDVPKVLLDCGVHAREWISHSLCQYFVGQLSDPNSGFAYLRDGVEWHVIPNVNPDGYKFSWTPAGRFWRKNRNPNRDNKTKKAQEENGAKNFGCGFSRGVGVDLNRNYDIMWTNNDMIGASKWCNSDSYRGAHAFSEPEAKGHADYISEGKFDAYLTMHSYAQVVLFPYTFSSRAPRPHNYQELMGLGEKIVDKIGANWRFGQGRDIFYPAAGGSDDWAHMKARIPISFTFELRDDGYYGFMLPERMIQKAVEEATRGVSAVYDHLVEKFNVSVEKPAASEEADKEVVVKKELVTMCPTNPEENFGDFDFSCRMKTGKCTYSCNGTPTHKFVKCKKNKARQTYAWWPSNSALVKCIPPLELEKSNQYFVDVMQGINPAFEPSDVFNLFGCRVIGGKKFECGIKCQSAVNCGKKCSGKAVMVRDKQGNLQMKKTVFNKLIDLIERC